MATFRTCIFSHQRRADGTYNIKLRITHHRKSRWISTTLYALPDDLTRGLKIKPSASAGAEFGRKKAISLDNICQMWKRPLRRGSTSVFANEK